MCEPETPQSYSSSTASVVPHFLESQDRNGCGASPEPDRVNTEELQCQSHGQLHPVSHIKVKHLGEGNGTPINGMGSCGKTQS